MRNNHFKKNLVAAAIAAICGTNQVAHASDSFEPDNTPQDFRPLFVGFPQVRSLHTPTDEDHLLITFNEDVTGAKLEALSDPSTPNVVLEFFDFQENFIADDSTTLEDDELLNPQISVIELGNLTAGQYRIRVDSRDGIQAVDQYEISFTVDEPAPPPPPPPPNPSAGSAATLVPTVILPLLLQDDDEQPPKP